MVITVQCPSCASSFPVDSNKIPEKGVSVRCSSCAQIFRIERPQEPAPPPPPVIEESAPEPAVEAPPTFSEPEPTPQAPEPEPVASAPEPEPEPESAASEAELPSFDAPSFEMEDADLEARDRDRDAETDFSIGTPEPTTGEDAAPAGSNEDWVFETEPEIDAGSLDIEPVDTVQSQVEEAKDEASFFGGSMDVETTEIPSAADLGEESTTPEPEVAAPEPEVSASEPEAPAPEPAAAPTPSVGAFTFGKRDPKDKARRLARVLVSDMIMYNPDRHERALANGTLKEDFEEEIQKSWKEYVEQVGEEMANSNDFWREALNDVLAKGQPIF